MKNVVGQITDCIEQTFELGAEKKNCSKQIIIYPFGDIGIQAMNLMKAVYALEPAYVIDNHKCKYNSSIHDISFLEKLDTENYVCLLLSTNSELYSELYQTISLYFPSDRIIELESMRKGVDDSQWETACGKYSYGPLCKHWLVKTVGNFCGFASGTDVVENHAMQYITTHPMIYCDRKASEIWGDYENYKDAGWYFRGVHPKAEGVKNCRITIGNDVWLGRNVIITNGANIGNGVIAGAGAVITRDVPDYAIVMGVPAKIVRYRYTPEQIEALNQIAWWDWTDEQIRERYDDLYLPVEEFIQKYLEK